VTLILWLNVFGAVLLIAGVVLWLAGVPYLGGVCWVVALLVAVAIAYEHRWRP
jgi:hypothetical protein